MRQPRLNKVAPTSPDKVHGKLVKYRKGDCLSILCGNGNYLAALISDKFNKHYDITLIEFYKSQQPHLNDFVDGRFFGTRFGSWEEVLTYAVDKRMLECKYIDNSQNVEKVGTLKLIESLEKASYAYCETLDELEDYYLKEIPIRIEKTKNAEKFPALAFVSKHLLEITRIIQ